MNEKQNPGQNPRFKPKRKKRGAAVAAVLCFVAAIAMVGTYTFNDYRKSQRELEQAKAQAEELELQNSEMEVIDTEESQAANTDTIVNSEEETEESTSMSETSEEEGDGGEDADGENDDGENAMGEDADEADTGQQKETETSGNAGQVSFSDSDKLLWPVEGALLMNYSMDKTVYFSTLDQYKYNPAIVISGEKGDQVISSAPGTVKSIDKTAETGTTVNVDLGGGYELLYGQLDKVQVKTGDYVDSKTVLGYVGEPTMYYSVEGTNVYFEMRKDGQPVNPMDYLVE